MWTILTKDAMDLCTRCATVCVLFRASLTVTLSAHVGSTVAHCAPGSCALRRHRDAVHPGALCVARRPRPHTIHLCHSWCRRGCRSRIWRWCRCRCVRGWCGACTLANCTLQSHLAWMQAILATHTMHLCAVRIAFRVLLSAFWILFAFFVAPTAHILISVVKHARRSRTLLRHRYTVHPGALCIACRPQPHTVN
jgi:hypothetical protein